MPAGSNRSRRPRNQSTASPAIVVPQRISGTMNQWRQGSDATMNTVATASQTKKPIMVLSIRPARETGSTRDALAAAIHLLQGAHAAGDIETAGRHRGERFGRPNRASGGAHGQC